MTTREIIEAYYSALRQQQRWADSFAEDVSFTSFISPPKHVRGHAAFIEATRGFYGMIASFETKSLLVEGDRACATTRYELQPPGAKAFTSDVAELFAV